MAERGARQRAGGVLDALDGHRALERHAGRGRALVDLRADVAGIDGRDRDPVALLEAQHVRVGDHAALGQRVGGGERDCHWASPEAMLTTRPRDSRRAGSAAAVTRQGPTRLTSRTASASSSGGSPRALRRAQPGVVDQHVEAAEALDRFGHGAVDRSPGRARRSRCRRRAGRGRRPRALLAQQLDRRAADPAGGAGDEDLMRARTPPGLKRAVRCRKRHVQSGHSVGLLPWASRYQLVQPVFQTVPCMRRWTSAWKRSSTSGDLDDVRAALVHRAQRVHHVGDLGLDHVDHRAVPEAGVRAEQDEEVREAGDRRCRGARAGCRPSGRRGSGRRGRARVRRPACRRRGSRCRRPARRPRARGRRRARSSARAPPRHRP